ncbi:MAG: hypothetical protein RBR35_01295 [Salinivirgaceae bacterium]|jgi:hypothetical protein|nr:hypothetical protein [Salinivirgaceae bacterium]
MIKFLKREEIKFLITYFILVISHHLLPNIIGQIVLFSTLIFFYFSKKKYYWLAIFVLILTSAAGFFSIFVKYPMVAGVPFQILVVLLIVAKVLSKSSMPHVFYRNIFIMLLFLLIMIRVTTDFDIKAILKHNTSFLLLIFLPALLMQIDEIEKFIKLICVGLLIVFIGQWFHIFTGESIAGTLFGAGRVAYYKMIESNTEGLVRSVEGIGISFMALVGSAFLIALKPKVRYNYIMLVISFISIWITATRGWIIASVIILIPMLFTLRKSQIVNITVVVVITVLLISQIDILNRQFYLALDRLETVESIATGDKSAGGTLLRLTDRHVPVWNKFLESPIFGWGYSKEYAKVADGHVGNQNLLLNVGIFGYTLFLILIFTYIFAMVKVGGSSSKMRLVSNILIAAIIAVFLIHSTSRQMFAFGGDFYSQFIIAFLFTLANYTYFHSNIY